MNSESVQGDDVFPVSPCEEDEEMCSGGRWQLNKRWSMMVRMRRSNAKRMKKEKLSDPTLSPSPAEVEEHNTTHMSCRSWCPACVHGKARDKHQRRDQSERGLPEEVFDCCFLGAEGEEETCRDSGGEGPSDPHDLRPHGVQGGYEFGADAMIDLEKWGHKEMILRRDGEFALKAVQEEVKARKNCPDDRGKLGSGRQSRIWSGRASCPSS